MSNKLLFRVYYKGGSTYIGPVENTPTDNVLVIVEFSNQHGRRLVSNGDYYCWDDKLQRWFPGDFIHFIQYMREPGMKRALFGRTVGPDEWNETMKRANSDPDFPTRSAYDFLEPRPAE